MYQLLVADDNKIGREAIDYLIQTNNLPFEVTQAKNGQEALQLIRQTQFDCVITDIRMPRLSGIELVKQVSEEEAHVPVFVIISGYQEFEDAQAAIEYGVRNYLVKPVDIEKFLKTMREIVEDLQARDERQMTDLERELEDALAGRRLPAEGQARQLLEQTNRVIVAYSDAQRSPEQTLLLGQEISTLSGGMTRLVRLDKTWDVILSFAPDQDSRQLRNFMHKLKLLYRQTDEGQIFMGISSHIASPQTLARQVQETIRCCDRKYFQSQPKIVYVDEDTDDMGDQLTEMDEKIGKLITDGEYIQARDALMDYLDTVSQMQNISTVFVRFQTSRFIQALFRHSVVEPKTSICNMVEEVGHAQSIPELKAIVLRLMDELLTKPDISREEIDAVELAEKIIREKYGTDLTLESIAQQVYLSPYYLSRAFKQKTGTNLFSYLTNVRMETGKRLLRDTDIKIAEISRRVGYDNPSYFGQVFKQYYGVTPKRFRYEGMQTEDPAES